jgi:tetratricopeptide (TPR) repeat protein
MSYDTLTFTRSVPDYAPFNHMITYLPGKTDRYLDPTCDVCNPYDLDVAYRGKPTLVIGTDLDDPLLQTPAPRPEDYQIFRRTRMEAQDDGLLVLDHEAEYLGQAALNWKNYISSSDSSDIAETVEDYSGVGFWRDAEFESYELFPDNDEPGPRFGWKCRMTKDSLFTKNWSRSQVSLWFYAVNEYISTPDTLERTLDLDVGERFRLTEQYTIIPTEVHELENYRAPWVMDTTWFTASSQVEEWGDSLRVTATFNLKTTRIPAAEVAPFVRAVKLVKNRVMNLSPIFRRRPDQERIGLIETALEQSPNDISLMITLAQEYLGSDLGGNYCSGEERRAQAREVLSRVLEADPSHEAAAMTLASLQLGDGLARRADSTIKAFEATNSSTLLIKMLGAATSVLLANYDEAEQRYVELLNQAPDDELRAQLANVFCHQNRLEEARTQIDLMETLKADSADFMLARLQYYLWLDSLDQAAALIEAWPDTSAIVQAGLKTQLYELSGEYDEAYKEFGALLAEHPDNSTFLNNTAWFMALAGADLERALELIERAMQLTGGCDTGTRNTRGVVLLRLGRLKDAKKDFEICLEDQSANSQTVNLYFMGEWALAEGKEDQAKEYFAGACAANGDDFYARQAGEALEKLGGSAEKCTR